MLDFLRSEFEHEIDRETRGVAADGLLECAGLDGVKLRELEIQHHLLFAQEKDALFGLECESVFGHLFGWAGVMVIRSSSFSPDMLEK